MLPVMVPDLLPPTVEMREKSVIVLEDLLQVRDWFLNWRKRDAKQRVYGKGNR